LICLLTIDIAYFTLDPKVSCSH